MRGLDLIAGALVLPAILQEIGHTHEYHLYQSDDHYILGEIRELAANRDVGFFLSH